MTAIQAPHLERRRSSGPASLSYLVRSGSWLTFISYLAPPISGTSHLGRTVQGIACSEGTSKRRRGSSVMDEREKRLKDTDRTAGFNMMKFVAIIFVIALAIAAIWFFVLTPADPNAVSG